MNFPALEHTAMGTTDFPSLPYAWDREIRLLCKAMMSDATLTRILGETVRELYGLSVLR